MPLYEYHCKKCGKTLEILQKVSEGNKKKCPECGGSLEKLVSQSAFHLKGTGWYKTDYASKTDKKPESKPAAKESEKVTPKPAEKKASSKSE